MSQKKREAATAYLLSKEASPPTRLDAAAPGNSEGAGSVVPNFEEGTLVVKSTSGMAQLVWAPADASPKRFLAPGKYQILNYKIARKEAMIWATGKGRTFEVAAGQETKIDIDLCVHVDLKATNARGKVALAMRLSGDAKMGLTFVRGDRRVLPTFETRRDGESLARGEFKFG